MIVVSVNQINAYLRELLEGDEILSDLWVQGEVSNVKRASSGHYYFTLKDDSAAIDAVMWKNNAARLSAPLKSGDAVLAHGSISIYEVNARLQLYADKIQPAGIGLLHARFEELKGRLDAEGLFEESRKRPLPPLPRQIGVATSAQGAALRDILKVLERRYPLVEVLLAPCLVQGDQAPASIISALEMLYAAEVDLIILARGGGSIEDLWSFNEEAVARAVFASPVPLITGVGHETDTTIVDYVADVRAPTPSAAAELAVPDSLALLQEAVALRQQIDALLAEHIEDRRRAIEEQEISLHHHEPTALINRSRQQIDELLRRAHERARYALETQTLRLTGLRNQLEAVSPNASLQRGYALVRRMSDGQVITHAEQVQAGERLLVTLRDGSLSVEIMAVQPSVPFEASENPEESNE